MNAPFLAPKNTPGLQNAIGEDKWVSHFSCLYCNNATPIICEEPSSGPEGHLPIRIDFNVDEVILAINTSVGGKAPDPDSIPVDLYKSCPLLWGPLLTLVLRACCTHGFTPTWIESTLVAIFKKGDRNDPACYRPNSLLDTLVKVAGRVVLNRLQSWVEDSGIISEAQYGFHKGLGTVEQGLNQSLILGKYTRAKKGSLFMCFADLFGV